MRVSLKQVSTTSGFLQDATVQFAPGLNCIIGARGTCKTTLVESIRFAFNLNEVRIKDLVGSSPDGLIRASLRAGVVRCDVVVADDRDNYAVTLERELDAPPRTYKDAVREYTNSELLGSIEIFSQGDLQRLAQDDEQQMRLELIDRPNRKRINLLRDERAKSTATLKSIGPDIRSVRLEIQEKTKQAKNLVEVRQQLNDVQANRPALPSGVEERFRAALRRKAILTDLQQAQSTVVEAANYLQNATTHAIAISSLIAKLEIHPSEEVPDAISILRDIHAAVTRAVEIGSAINSNAIDSMLAETAARFAKADDEYYRLRQEQQQVNESLKREETLRTQVQHLENVESDLQTLVSKEQQLLGDRQKHRASILGFSDEIYRLRLGEVDKINKQHSDVVLLTLTPGEQTSQYRECVTQILSRSRIKLQDEVAGDIAKGLKPSELIDLVENGNAAEIAESLGRDFGQAMRLVSHLSDHPELYELEGELFEDRLDVTMYDNGTPKPVETLSKGQKATALLPLILRDAPYPLIIDQPEDDLDNSFIYQSLVKVIRELKKTRQLIFVTHNANIPVLGEAERVVVMSMKTPTAAAKPGIGDLESRKADILDLLEGGKEAFEEREKHYANLLSRGDGK